MTFLRLFLALLSVALLSPPLHAADTTTAANAINSLGIDLLAKTGKPDQNALLSPYSIQTALAMTYAGADGKTRDEMATVLHFPADDAEVNGSFSELQKELLDIEQSTAKLVAGSKHGGPSEPITIAIADRLFGQQGYDFRKPFLDLIKDNYGAPLETLDFAKQAEAATNHINSWVAEQTRQRILDLIPPSAITPDTRLVLVNAIYLKAPWAKEFKKSDTEPKPFHAPGNKTNNVPTMSLQHSFGYLKRDGYAAISIPYVGSDLEFLILLPDEVDGLPALEKKLTPAMLAEWAGSYKKNIFLYLPKFKIAPPTVALADALQVLGMKSAFDIPKGSANFDRMAPRKPDDYLYISQVFHKTFLSLDENGTEAAAATAVVMMRSLAMGDNSWPLYVHIDHPFLFAIQHKQSGACIFLGRVTNPN
ncbi:MAG: serpin family protein [Chthoniobacteraceae bacterium]